ncbi:MAG: helix-turn-helix transcriptional regulator [Polyangiaceae bacterium]|nr:helix-turn-helix transcriptional regulator [Polyangiaceae bacterium]
MSLPVRKSRAPAQPTCQVTDALGFLRGAWALNVIWQLRDQPRRFGELRRDIPGISARILSLRLRELEERGLVVRRALVGSSPPSAEYVLTDLGRELLPAIDIFAAVGEKLIAVWSAHHFLKRRSKKLPRA